MESLVATYASSDEEEEENSASTLSSSLPPPKNPSSSSSSSSSASSLFRSLPQPKQQQHSSSSSIPICNIQDDEQQIGPKLSSKLFNSLPQPKTQIQNPPSNIPKRVVQFKLPIIHPKASQFHDEDEDDDEDEDEKELKRQKDAESLSQSSSVKSFLSSIPAPRNSSSSSLGVLPSASGTARRSILETHEETPSNSQGFGAENASVVDHSVGNYGGYDGSYASNQSDFDQYGGGGYVGYGSYGSYDMGAENAGVAVDDGSSYATYGDYGQSGNEWGDVSAAAVADTAVAGEGVVRMLGKRGRNQMPADIIEVKQDELTKNRPREDQVKLTGIAFGPSYQPASVKGKPSKLHKRKHQIGSLFFDMKQKEMELAERRAKGHLTKAQTQGKYGW